MPVVEGDDYRVLGAGGPRELYNPYYYLRAMIAFKAWGCARRRGNQVYIPRMNVWLPFHLFHVVSQELGIWLHHYRPNIKGAVVLDAGAGAGETCWLFLKVFGARKVVAVEPNPTRFDLLKENATANGWNVELIHGILQPEYLANVDFAKIDIEGAEVELLDVKFPPCAIEVHSFNDRTRTRQDWVVRAFERKGFHKVFSGLRGGMIMRNVE